LNFGKHTIEQNFEDLTEDLNPLTLSPFWVRQWKLVC